MRKASETFRTILNTPTFELWVSQRKKKRKVLRKLLKKL